MAGGELAEALGREGVREQLAGALVAELGHLLLGGGIGRLAELDLPGVAERDVRKAVGEIRRVVRVAELRPHRGEVGRREGEPERGHLGAPRLGVRLRRAGDPARLGRVSRGREARGGEAVRLGDFGVPAVEEAVHALHVARELGEEVAQAVRLAGARDAQVDHDAELTEELVGVFQDVAQRVAPEVALHEDEPAADGHPGEPVRVGLLAAGEDRERGDLVPGQAGHGGGFVEGGFVAGLVGRGQMVHRGGRGGGREQARELDLRGAGGGHLGADGLSDGALVHAVAEQEHEEGDRQDDDRQREGRAEEPVLHAADAKRPGLAQRHSVLLPDVDFADDGWLAHGIGNRMLKVKAPGTDPRAAPRMPAAKGRGRWRGPCPRGLPSVRAVRASCRFPRRLRPPCPVCGRPGARWA